MTAFKAADTSFLGVTSMYSFSTPAKNSVSHNDVIGPPVFVIVPMPERYTRYNMLPVSRKVKPNSNSAALYFTKKTSA